jgi:hypothetical protein
MRRHLLGAALLLLGLGCDRLVHGGKPPVYAPWEEGLTLSFMDPSRPGLPNLQVRVDRCRGEGNASTVATTYTTLETQLSATFFLRDGGTALVREGQPSRVILPDGFPERVSRWEDEDHRLNQVIGRTLVHLDGVSLPNPQTLGVWVESRGQDGTGPARRTLLVPDFGEVQAFEFRQGRWVEVNRLASWTFTDQPGREMP